MGAGQEATEAGELELPREDVLFFATRSFPDAIARGAYPIDIHNPTGTGRTLKRVPLDNRRATSQNDDSGAA